MRDWILAVLLALAAAAITKGVSDLSTAVAWIVGGLLFGALAYLTVTE